VDYLFADVLDLPRDWHRRFDLVVESLTVQSMPPDQHTAATTRDESSAVNGPPWPLTRAELDDFANSDLILRQVERIENGTWWRAELSSDARGSTGQSTS